MEIEKINKDNLVVQAFGEEWSRFSQESLTTEQRIAIFDDYFSIFPWSELPSNSIGADVGCGSGRWAEVVAARVGRLICVDASSEALKVAQRNLHYLKNVGFQEADVGLLPFGEGELDFVYSLGVLHHVPDTERAISNICRVLKQGGLFLVYLYYAFDNRPSWYRFVWRFSDLARQLICRTPSKMRFWICDLIAALFYWPLARIAALLEVLEITSTHFPLHYYRDKSFYVMRTDALDRFGTRLEKRFTKEQIIELLTRAGFSEIRFSDRPPYWCALARKR
jgi:SAM-dependent methyltransferase